MPTGGRLTKPNKTMNNQNHNKTQGAVGIGSSAVLGGVLVKFENVGRGKMKWEMTLPNLEYKTLLKAVKQRHAIASRYPEFVIDDDGSGSIFCGFHFCGSFYWRRLSPPNGQEMSHATCDANREGGTDSANRVGSSDVLDRPPCASPQLIKKSQHILLTFLVCGVSCFLPLRVGASPTIKSDIFVSVQSPLKSSDQSWLNEMLNLESLSLQFGNLHILPNINKLGVCLAGNAALQVAHEIPKPSPLNGGIVGSPQTIAEQHDNQSANGSAPDVSNLVEPRAMYFLSHVVSGAAGALAYIIANWLLNQMGTRWRSNAPSSPTADGGRL